MWLNCWIALKSMMVCCHYYRRSVHLAIENRRQTPSTQLTNKYYKLKNFFFFVFCLYVRPFVRLNNPNSAFEFCWCDDGRDSNEDEKLWESTTNFVSIKLLPNWNDTHTHTHTNSFGVRMCEQFFKYQTNSTWQPHREADREWKRKIVNCIFDHTRMSFR